MDGAVFTSAAKAGTVDAKRVAAAIRAQNIFSFFISPFLLCHIFYCGYMITSNQNIIHIQLSADLSVFGQFAEQSSIFGQFAI